MGRVLSVHDGDTFMVSLDGRKEKVRLIGIDAPELAQAPWGEQAHASLETLIQGRLVRSETDIAERDQYGRLLAYVYGDESFVNLELLRQGQAVLYTVLPNVVHIEEYRGREARQAGRGVWDQGTPLTVSPECYRKQQKGLACQHVWGPWRMVNAPGSRPRVSYSVRVIQRYEHRDGFQATVCARKGRAL